jgi:hypothetical protein
LPTAVAPVGNILRDDGTSPNYRVVTNAHARENNGVSADPDVPANANRAAKLKSNFSHGRVAWVICGVDVNTRANLCAVSNQNFDHVQDDAVEIDECASTEFDVEAVITKEWGPNFDTITDVTKPL